MSDSVRPHRRQPTRLPYPWDSPGKNTGVGCHFLLQCMKVKSESEVAQPCPTLSTPGLQPTRLLHPWDFPGKSTGVGCHCLLRHQEPTKWQILFLVSSVARLWPTLCNPMDCSTPGFPSFTVSWSLLKLMPIELVMLSNHLILCRHFSFCLQPFPASGFFPVSQLFASDGHVWSWILWS